MVYLVVVWTWMLSALTFVRPHDNTGVTQDQMSTRANTLSDDADDIQRQLDNEARDRVQFARPPGLLISTLNNKLNNPSVRLGGGPKTIWVFHLPSIVPELSTESLSRGPYLHNEKRCAAQNKSCDNLKPISAADFDYWEYSGQCKWSMLYPDCAGTSQSPIDLPTQGLIKTRPGRQLVFSHYDAMPENLTLRDDGKRLTLYGKWKPGLRPLIYGGAAHSRRYLFHSLNLHWPSEHFIGGFQYPMESHVIHISAEYRSLREAIEASASDPLAILNIANIYMFGNHSQTCIEELIKASVSIGVGEKILTRRPLSDFSPPFKEYVTYQGSLSAPPCTQAVLWMVRARSLVITRSTAAWARTLLAPGGEPRKTLLRQLQPRNDRKIFLFT